MIMMGTYLAHDKIAVFPLNLHLTCQNGTNANHVRFVVEVIELFKFHRTPMKNLALSIAEKFQLRPPMLA